MPSLPNEAACHAAGKGTRGAPQSVSIRRLRCHEGFTHVPPPQPPHPKPAAELPAGERVKWAIRGSSISTPFRLPRVPDATWHGMLHRWLDLTFTPCGRLMPDVASVRERQPSYTVADRRTCAESTLEFVDLALGASGGIWAEKCLLKPDKVRVAGGVGRGAVCHAAWDAAERKG